MIEERSLVQPLKRIVWRRNSFKGDALEESCEILCLTVLKKAIEEAQNGDPYHRQQALNWLLSAYERIRSLIWTCTNLGLAPNAIRHQCLKEG